MAVWDSASIRANRVAPGVLLSRDTPQVDESKIEPEISGKWHPAATLAFVVASCGLLWAGIFALIALVF